MTVPAGVVLAAGAGTRLRPLSDLRPKALCPVGTVPLLDLALGVARPHCGDGPDHLAVNAHHFADRISDHVRGRAHVSIEQPEALGTAGALGALRDWIDGRPALVINADAYLPGGVEALLHGWDGQRCRLAVLPTEGPADFVDDAGPVRFVGASLLPWSQVRELSPTPSGLYEALWRAEHAAGRLDLARLDGVAVDCGTPTDYLRANMHASAGRPVVDDRAVVEGTLVRSVVWDGAWVGADERLVDCVRAGTRTSPVTVRGDGPTGLD
jgi:CTP:molybdopterin cytidylyltransferase MocA